VIIANRQKIRVFFAVSCIVLAGASLPVRAELVSGIAAIVNEDVVTSYEVDKELAFLVKEAEQKGPVTPEARKELRKTTLNMLIDKRLILQKIKELNIQVSEEEVRQAVEDVKKQNKLSQEALVGALLNQGLTFDQYKTQLKEQLERLRLMSMEVKAKVQVSDREMRDYYEANKAAYSTDESYRARHIFFRIPKNATAEEIKKAMARAVNVINEARSGMDFAELARKYSDEATAAKDGGDLGVFKKGDMLPEIEGAVLGMKAGEISELVSTPAGFHIIKLEERIVAKAKPCEEVKAGIEDLLYKKKSEERFSQWAADLRKGAAIEIKQ
jgi:peptidyl-prolyl cis-trans isomerase SurA